MLEPVKASKEKTREFSDEQIISFTHHLMYSAIDSDQRAEFMWLFKQNDGSHRIFGAVSFVPSRQDNDILYLIKATAVKTTTIALSIPVLLARYISFSQDEVLGYLLDSTAGTGLGANEHEKQISRIIKEITNFSKGSALDLKSCLLVKYYLLLCVYRMFIPIMNDDATAILGKELHDLAEGLDLKVGDLICFRFKE